MAARWILAALLVTIAAAAPRVAPARADLTIAQFAEELQTIEQQIAALDPAHPERASGVVARIPRSWPVTADGRQFDVPGLWIRAELGRWMAHPDPAGQTALLARVSTLRRDALGYGDRAADLSALRTSLTRILAEREFAGVGGPSWWARLKSRILGWLEQVVTHALGSTAVPVVTNILIYGLSIVAVIVVFVWIQRQVRRRIAIDPAFQPPPAAPSDRPWPVWLAEARTASAEGQWREAIHLAYWCGVSFLESQHAWRPDASRTPREYTRAFTEAGARADALRQLTTLLERVWYAGDTASADGFNEALAHLGALGCLSQ